MAAAGVSFNHLGARASSVSSGSGGAPSASATASYDDLFFLIALDTNLPVHTGTLTVTADVGGLLTETGGASASAGAILALGGLFDQVIFEGSGTRSGHLFVTVDLATQGDEINVGLLLGASAANGSDPGGSTGEANFSTSAMITSVQYRNDQGMPDPNVIITTASGRNYPVPEPSLEILTLMASLIGALAARREHSR